MNPCEYADFPYSRKVRKCIIYGCKNAVACLLPLKVHELVSAFVHPISAQEFFHSQYIAKTVSYLFTSSLNHKLLI